MSRAYRQREPDPAISRSVYLVANAFKLHELKD